MNAIAGAILILAAAVILAPGLCQNRTSEAANGTAILIALFGCGFLLAGILGGRGRGKDKKD